jgi:hypothetical protein
MAASEACRVSAVLRGRYARSFVDDQTSQPQTGARGQFSISVGHEGLRSCEAGT